MEALEKEWKNGGEGKKSRALLFCSRHQLRISSVRCSRRQRQLQSVGWCSESQNDSRQVLSAALCYMRADSAVYKQTLFYDKPIQIE